MVHPKSGTEDKSEKNDAPASLWRHIYGLLILHLVHSPGFPQFLIAASFLISFGGIRLVTHGIRGGWLPFGNIEGSGGLHIHHYLIGIGLVLLLGYIQIAFRPKRGRVISAGTSSHEATGTTGYPGTPISAIMIRTAGAPTTEPSRESCRLKEGGTRRHDV